MGERLRFMALARIALRNLARRRLRTILTVVGIALGVSLIFAVEVGRVSTIDSFLTMIDDLAGKSSIQVRAEAGGGFPEAKLDKISSIDQVKLAVPAIIRVIQVKAAGEEAPVAMQFLGIDPDLDRRVRRYELKTGRWLREKTDVLISASYARQIAVEVGDPLALLTPEGEIAVEVSGLLEDTGVGQTARGTVLVAPLKLAQQIYLLENQITTADVVLDRDVSVGPVKKRLARVIGANLILERPADRGTSITRTVNFVMSSMDSMALLVLLAGAFIIFGTLRMNIEEQERQIGIMRAVGASRPQVFFMAMFQGLLLGTIGSLAGLFMGYGFAGALVDAVQGMYQFAPGTLSSVSVPAIQAMLGGVGVSMLATLTPALRASRLPPVAAMAGEAQPGRHRMESLWLVLPLVAAMAASLLWFKPKTTFAYNTQLVLVVLGVIVISPRLVRVFGAVLTAVFHRLLGKDGLIAGRNLVRGRAQTATALATIVLSLVITLVMGELAASDRQFFTRIVSAVLPYDLNIGTPPYSTFSANQRPPMDERVAERIEAVEGVRRADPVRFLAVKGLDIDLFGIFLESSRVPPRKMQVNEMPMQQAMNLLEGGNRVILGSAVTKKTGIQVGEKISLKTPAGRRRFEVIATIHHPASNGEVALMSRRVQEKYWHDSGIDYFQILVNKGADAEIVKERLIDEIGKPYGVTVVSSEEEHDTIMAALEQFLGTLDSMALIAAIIAALAVVNAQVMNVLQRQREIAVMRAVGSSRWLIRRLIILEAAFLGLIGLAVGLTVGMPLARSVVVIGEEISGFALSYVWPGEPLAVAVFIALGVTLLASIYPAERAARVRIVGAMKR